ncbi:MAG: putative rane protein [Dehalococcoidales bacterium]|nr:putative rane protein [Dehalococcoidales bacterium]
MPAALVVLLSALATWLLLALALFIEAWTWEHNIGIGIDLTVPVWGGRIWQRVIAVTLLLAILATLGSLGYVIAAPKAEGKTTEFYLLGLGGRASNYPARLGVGEEGKIRVGIINGEHEITTYRMEVTIDGVSNSKVGPITLNHGSKWEEIVGFTPSVAGDKQRVAFWLYRAGDAKAYRTVYLRVDVR